MDVRCCHRCRRRFRRHRCRHHHCGCFHCCRCLGCNVSHGYGYSLCRSWLCACPGIQCTCTCTQSTSWSLQENRVWSRTFWNGRWSSDVRTLTSPLSHRKPHLILRLPCLDSKHHPPPSPCKTLMRLPPALQGSFTTINITILVPSTQFLFRLVTAIHIY